MTHLLCSLPSIDKLKKVLLLTGVAVSLSAVSAQAMEDEEYPRSVSTTVGEVRQAFKEKRPLYDRHNVRKHLYKVIKLSDTLPGLLDEKEVVFTPAFSSWTPGNSLYVMLENAPQFTYNTDGTIKKTTGGSPGVFSATIEPCPDDAGAQK